MGKALRIRETLRAQAMLNEPLDFCLLNEAIRKADTMDRLNELARIIKREIELEYAWSRDAANVEHLRKDWRQRKKLIEEQTQRVNPQRRRYVSDRLKVRR